MTQVKWVVDASALLAAIHNEKGAGIMSNNIFSDALYPQSIGQRFYKNWKDQVSIPIKSKCL